MPTTTVLILHGNGGVRIEDGWYDWFAESLRGDLGFVVLFSILPDEVISNCGACLQHIEDQIAGRENVVIVGHSSGAEAALRFAESHPVQGLILLTPYITHCGAPSEMASGYFDSRWQPIRIRQNVQWIIQISSLEDPFIRYKNQSQLIRRMLRTPPNAKVPFDFTFYRGENMGHIGKEMKTVNFLVEILCKKLKKSDLPLSICSMETKMVSGSADEGMVEEVFLFNVRNGEEEEPIQIDVPADGSNAFAQSFTDAAGILPVENDEVVLNLVLVVTN